MQNNGALTPIIKISNLTLEYKAHKLFNNFAFVLYPQKWSCLLGISGVGKTTLLRVIADLISKNLPDYKYTFDSFNNQNSNISYMAQQDLLLPWLTVLDNVLIGYRLRKNKITPQLKERAIELLVQVGLNNTIQLFPKQLSAGMKQRVALARTLMEDRQIILMDEPFSALDVITKIKLQTLAATLLRDRTVLLVTHDPLEALRLGDFIYVLTGAPAKLHQASTPKGQAPRDITNIDVLNEQAQLLKILEAETENE